MGQINGSSLHMVHKTTRCRHNNIRLLAKRAKLSFDILSAINRQCMNRQVLGKPIHLFRRLDGQFSRWRKHDSLRPFFCRVNLFQNRNTKCRCFARTGLCLSNQILPLHRRGNRYLLDRSGLLKSHIFNSLHDFRNKAQFLKCIVHNTSCTKKGNAQALPIIDLFVACNFVIIT